MALAIFGEQEARDEETTKHKEEINANPSAALPSS
jgi:hypothetical protein